MDGTYKYRAVDYIESSDFNNAVYKNISFTEETGSVWQFGSFENPIDGDNKDTLGYMNYSIGDDAKELKEHFKPYELLRYGKWYNPLAVVTKTDGNMGVTYDYGMVGVLHTTLGTAFPSTDKSHQNMGLPYQSKGFMVTVGSKTGRDDKIHNMGIYMKFISPISGNMKLNLTDIAPISGGCKVMVLRNDCVFATYTKVALNTVVDFGFVNKGESIYICYGTNSDKVFYNYGGSPIVTISGERFNVTVGSKYNYSVAAGENIKLPLVSNKIGKTVLGWKGNTEIIYSPGENIVVENPESFASLESYYGDLTGDGYINATDISAMRKCIIDGVECILSVSDINTDGEFNAIDIVRMKKWLAGYTVAFNVG